MSKSNPNAGSFIALLDEPKVIRKKISRATTDSGSEVRYDLANKPEISNLMSIYSQCSGLSLQEVQDRYEGQMYGTFKKELAETVVAMLEPIQQRYRDIRESGEIGHILAQSAERAQEAAEVTLSAVKERMGFLPRLR